MKNISLRLFNNPDIGFYNHRPQVNVVDNIFTSLPNPNTDLVDSRSVSNGDRILFTNLSDPTQNNKIYDVEFDIGTILKFVISPSNKSPSGDPMEGDATFVRSGTYEQTLVTFDNNEWKFIDLDTDDLDDLKVDGSTSPLANINWGGFKITNLGAPSIDSDASTKKYVDDEIAGLSQDHGDLTGLVDDDHTQYHNDVRGDIRYYTKTQLDAGQLDGQYFQETEFINTSVGIADAGKPIVLDASGLINSNMISFPTETDPVWAAQGFRRDGTVAMTGNFDAGSNDLLNVNKISMPLAGFVGFELARSGNEVEFNIDSTFGQYVFAFSDGNKWSITPQGYLDGLDTTDGGFRVRNQTSVATPPAGRVHIYPASDRLKQKGSAGTEETFAFISEVVTAETDPIWAAQGFRRDGTVTMTGNFNTGGNKIVATAAFSLESNSNNNQLLLNTNGTLQMDGLGVQGPTSGPANSLFIGSAPSLVTGTGNTLINNAFSALTTGFNNIGIGAVGVFSSVTTGGKNIGIGINAGIQSPSNADDNVVLGHGAGQGHSLLFDENVVIGSLAGFHGSPGHGLSQSILIGHGAGGNVSWGTVSSSIMLGVDALFSSNSSPSNEMVIGSSTYNISDIYWGEGGRTNGPDTTVTHRPSNANGTDISHLGDFVIAGGAGTGTGVGSHILFKTAAAGSTGSTVNGLITRMEITDNGVIDFKDSALTNMDGLDWLGPTSGPIYTGIVGKIPASLTGVNNVVFSGGREAFQSATTAQSNAIFGNQAGRSLTIGSDNTMLGNAAGANSDADADRNVLIGGGAGSGANTQDDNIVIGTSTGQNSTLNKAIIIGTDSINGGGYIVTNSIALGHRARFTETTGVTNQMVVGSSLDPIVNFYWGEGGRGSTSVTTHSTAPAFGTDISHSGDHIFAGGQGTGTGVGSHILFQTAPAGLTGSTVNPLVTRMEITDQGDIDVKGNNIISSSLFSLTASGDTNQLLLNTDGSLQLDGASFLGPTSGPTNSIVVGTNPALITGTNNTGFGIGSLGSITSGARNTGFGKSSLGSILTSSDSTALGYEALGGFGVTGANNTAVGSRAMNVGSGSNNTAIGGSALRSSTGSNNIAVGLNAGHGLTGSGNIALGHNTNSVFPAFSSLAVSNEMVIGTETSKIGNIFIGMGAQAGAPTLVALNATRGKGTDVSAADFWIVGGAGTGAGTGGHLHFKTAEAGGTGSTVNTPVTRFEITDDNKISFHGVPAVAQAANVGQLTDNTTGTADGTVADVGVVFSQATLNNNFADLTDKINKLETIIKDKGFSA